MDVSLRSSYYAEKFDRAVKIHLASNCLLIEQYVMVNHAGF